MSDGLNLKYTLCFIRAGNQILMLNRGKAPNMGLWNGIGGKIERGEDPMDCVLREVQEEANWTIPLPRFAGIVTWDTAQETGSAGMYVFVADVKENDEAVGACELIDEGVLSWFTREWIMDTRNFGVVSNIPYFLPAMLNEATPVNYHCVYNPATGVLLNVEPELLPIEIVNWAARWERIRGHVLQEAAGGGKRA